MSQIHWTFPTKRAMFQPKRYMASRIVQDVLDVSILNNAQNSQSSNCPSFLELSDFSDSNFSTFPKFKNTPFQLFDFLSLNMLHQRFKFCEN